MTAPESHFGRILRVPPTQSLGASTRPRFDRPVFIVSAPRSGSSLLFETLAAHPIFRTLGGEASWLVESFPELCPGADGVDSNRLTAEHCTPPIATRIRAILSDRLVDAQGEAVTDEEAVRLLEKTSNNSLRIPFFLRMFPDARFIFLWRDPQETLSSIMEAWRSRGWESYGNLPGCTEKWSMLLPPGWPSVIGQPLEVIAALQWEAANRIILDDLAGLPEQRWTALSYAEFLADPRAQAQRLCAFAEIPFDARLARRLESPLPPSRHTLTAPSSGKWRKNEAEILRVLPSIEPVWERLKDLSGAVQVPSHVAQPLQSGEEARAVNKVIQQPSRPLSLADRGLFMSDLFDKDDVSCSVTNRTHIKDTSMREFMEGWYGFLPLSHIKDTFGFVEEFTELYGGRPYIPNKVLSHRDVAELYDMGIGVKLCLQNHFITQEDCEANRAFLTRYHRKGNVIICVSDVLARFVKTEFPDYVVEASIIKGAQDLETIQESLELFDLLTLLPEANDDLDFLTSLPQKDRIILFGNARCLYNCNLRTCYQNNSVLMKRASNPEFGSFLPRCSLNAPRQSEYTVFDLNRLYAMGFRRFKWIIPDVPIHQQAALKPGTYQITRSS